MQIVRRGARTPLSEEEGVRAAYAAHGAELYRFALRGLGDEGAAQDAVQETFLRAWRSADRYDAAKASQRVWLFAIARNVLVDQRRFRRARPWWGSAGEVDELEQHPAQTDELNDLMRGWVVEQALLRIGADHRQALEETYLADRPYAEVAEELDIPVSTLRSRVFYGLKALRVVLEEMEVTW